MRIHKNGNVILKPYVELFENQNSQNSETVKLKSTNILKTILQKATGSEYGCSHYRRGC